MPRQNRAESSKAQAASREFTRAEEDYQRLRAAYLEVATKERGNEVALAMIGADMDRAHATMQGLAGLRQLAYTHEPSTVVRREARWLVEQNS